MRFIMCRTSQSRLTRWVLGCLAMLPWILGTLREYTVALFSNLAAFGMST